MGISLHIPKGKNKLSIYYQRAFSRAIELAIVNAYLTDWDSSFILNTECKQFLFIIGKDFGLTRIAACKKVMKWVPTEHKTRFMVATSLSGFHPKAVFWREDSGKCYVIIGSSNLTRAAFESNYEANIFSEIQESEYAAAWVWLRTIKKWSHSVSTDWLNNYKEAKIGLGGKKLGATKRKKAKIQSPIKLPVSKEMEKYIKKRRSQIKIFGKYRSGIIRLFEQCASERINSGKLYSMLNNYWSKDRGDRLQGKGWEIKGKNSNFVELSRSILNILNANPIERDDIVEDEIDNLCSTNNGARGAFLSEMLCLLFPDDYPVLNKPVQAYLKEIKLQTPRGASKGAKYVDIAQKLRLSLNHNHTYLAKNLAELDAVIWLHCDRRDKK